MGSLPNSKTYLQTIVKSPFMKCKVLMSHKNNTNFMTSLTLNADEPFYILDLDVVANLMNRWAISMPEYRPFYAVKCNSNSTLLSALAALGSGFDCASKAEIEQVLALGVSPENIIFANPCKLDSDVEFAASVGVNLTTFDSHSEILKIHKLHPRCVLLLRIKPPIECSAIRDLGSKYGALSNEVEPLLRAARNAGLSVAGVSFHVGSATTNPHSYNAAIYAAKTAFDTAIKLNMPPMQVLNIGGGFFAVDDHFENSASTINKAVSDHFIGNNNNNNDNESIRLGLGLRVMAEPGRFFAESAFTFAVKIVGKRARGEEREYLINDGVYGSFLGMVVTGTGNGSELTCVPLSNDSNNVHCAWFKSTVFGQTCDSLDTVLKSYRLPEMEVGDWLGFPNMGAYTSVFKSNFNGFNPKPYSTIVVANPLD